jgi:hypothetical protein
MDEKATLVGKKDKNEQLKQYRAVNTGPGQVMTSDSGYKIADNRRSLREEPAAP